ncbi:hypothetical protein QR680_000163 [Steinernema hermaphroditum]|uniref:Uncharacterized protein n=1 Tax=Steinernema hermaphroditum TaxID=289476 RepID=A0AA39LDU2_9BILA|nr:hypothetical protein QR680_000163 [Steinernema hermaphroditum]
MVMAADGHIRFADQRATRYMRKLDEARKNFIQRNISIIASVFCTMSRTRIARNTMRSMLFFLITWHSELTPSTKKNFAKLLEEINRLSQAPDDQRSPYTLNVRIPGSEMNVGRLYDVKVLNSLDAVL